MSLVLMPCCAVDKESSAAAATRPDATPAHPFDVAAGNGHGASEAEDADASAGAEDLRHGFARSPSIEVPQVLYTPAPVPPLVYLHTTSESSYQDVW